MRSSRRLFLLTRAALLLGLMAGGLCLNPAWPTPVAAGTAITNTATGSYIDSASGVNVRLISNTVATVVQPFEALTLTSNQTVTSAPGTIFPGLPAPRKCTKSANTFTRLGLTASATTIFHDN